MMHHSSFGPRHLLLLLALCLVATSCQRHAPTGVDTGTRRDLDPASGQSEALEGILLITWGDPFSFGGDPQRELSLTDDSGRRTRLLIDDGLLSVIGEPREFNGRRFRVQGPRLSRF